MTVADDDEPRPTVVGVNVSPEGNRRRRSPGTGATWQAMVRHSMRALRRGALPEHRLATPGAEAVALWRKQGCGSVLFRLDATDSDLPFSAVLEHVDGRRRGPWWSCTGGGSGGHDDEPPSDPGLVSLGGATDNRARLLIGHASPDTLAIRLVDGDRTWTEPVGHHGFVLLGALVSDPPVSAVALNADGVPLGDTHRV
jgi:hypothetical protein